MMSIPKEKNSLKNETKKINKTKKIVLTFIEFLKISLIF